jgi:hypothetical protein
LRLPREEADRRGRFDRWILQSGLVAQDRLLAVPEALKTRIWLRALVTLSCIKSKQELRLRFPIN